MIGWVLLSAAGGRCVFQIDIWFRLGLEAVLPFLCKEILRQLSSDRSTRYGHDPDGHQWLLYRVELDNRKADCREQLQPARSGYTFLASNPLFQRENPLVLPFRMKGTSPSRASRAPEGLRFTATQCHDGEVKLFINLF